MKNSRGKSSEASKQAGRQAGRQKGLWNLLWMFFEWRLRPTILKNTKNILLMPNEGFFFLRKEQRKRKKNAGDKVVRKKTSNRFLTINKKIHKNVIISFWEEINPHFFFFFGGRGSKKRKLTFKLKLSSCCLLPVAWQDQEKNSFIKLEK